MLTAVRLITPHNCGVEIIQEPQQPDPPVRQRVAAEQASARRLDHPDTYQSVQRGAEHFGVGVNRQCLFKGLTLADGRQGLDQ